MANRRPLCCGALARKWRRALKICVGHGATCTVSRNRLDSCSPPGSARDGAQPPAERTRRCQRDWAITQLEDASVR